jgi:hypothetical protein
MAYVPSWERLFDALRRVAVRVSIDEAKVAISRAIADRKIRVRLTVGPHADPLMRPMFLNPSPALECIEGTNVHLPSHLSPHDLDWPNSRPLKPLQIRPRDRRSIARPFSWPNRTVSLIEVQIDDVTWLIDEITKSAHGGIASESTSSTPSDHTVTQSTPPMSRDDATGNGASSLEHSGAPPEEPPPAISPRQPLLPDPRDLIGVPAVPAPKKSRPGRERARRAIDELYHGDVPDQATEPNWRLCKRVGKRLEELGLPNVSNDTILRAAGRRK